jgi:hypothetical protein
MSALHHAPTGSASFLPIPLRLYRLPRELLDQILQDLDMEDYISFVFADYFAARGLSLAPSVTPRTFFQLLVPPTRQGTFQQMNIPTELTAMILRHLPRHDLIALVLADYDNLHSIGIAPPLTAVTLTRMKMAIRAPSNAVVNNHS